MASRETAGPKRMWRSIGATAGSMTGASKLKGARIRYFAGALQTCTLPPVNDRSAVATLSDPLSTSAEITEQERAAPQTLVREDALPDEEAVVEKARTGDRKALGALLRHHGPRLYRAVLLPRLGSEAAAKDALSETYAKVCANIEKFTWQAKGFYPWLRVIALNTALDQLRGRKRQVLWSSEDVERELDATATATPLDAKLSEAHDRAAAKTRVTAALAKVNERYARAIQLRVLEERPREEVAALLEVSVATFDVVLHRALAALRKVLESPAQTLDGKEVA